MTQTENLALIETLITERPQGIGIAALEKALAQRTGTTVQRRTLQRRLERLLKDRCIVAEGRSVALVYKLALPGAAASVAQAQPGAEAELYVPLSPEDAAIRERVRLALMHRRPVGYQREFFEAYVPGVTFYLPESIRAQLHEMGRTPAAPAGEWPARNYARDIMNRLLVDLSWASSRLEGNTYSRLDTQNLIEFG